MRKPRATRTAVAAGVAALTLGVGGAALAATGTLPGAADQHARDALTSNGTTVPGPADAAGDHPDARGESTATHPADDPTTEAADAATGAAISTATTEAAQPSQRPTDTHGYEVSQFAKTTTLTGRQKGEAISALASGGRSTKGQSHAKPKATPTPSPETTEPTTDPSDSTEGSQGSTASSAGADNADTSHH